MTESVLIRNVANTAVRLQAIKALGVRTAIDDFGTGYSGCVPVAVPLCRSRSIADSGTRSPRLPNRRHLFERWCRSAATSDSRPSPKVSRPKVRWITSAVSRSTRPRVSCCPRPLDPQTLEETCAFPDSSGATRSRSPPAKALRPLRNAEATVDSFGPGRVLCEANVAQGSIAIASTPRNLDAMSDAMARCGDLDQSDDERWSARRFAIRLRWTLPVGPRGMLSTITTCSGVLNFARCVAANRRSSVAVGDGTAS